MPQEAEKKFWRTPELVDRLVTNFLEGSFDHLLGGLLKVYTEQIGNLIGQLLELLN